MLEIVDLLVHKVDERAKIIFLSDAAQALVEYANINLEYLNPILQNKIYHTENPLSIQKLIKSGRLLICRDIQEYLDQKKASQSYNEYQREILICSHESLRLGDSVYWLFNLNKHAALSSHLILTEPHNDLLLRPFKNSLKVHYCPVNATISRASLSQLTTKLNPKRVISPYDISVIQPQTSCVVDSIQKGQTKQLEEDEIGSLKYKGVCPTSIASVIRIQPSADGRMISRVTDL